MQCPLASVSWFHDIAPKINIDKADRIELSVSDVEPALLEQALELTTPCCRCGAPVHPFRRRAEAERRAPTTGAVFLSCSCPMDRSGCARSKAAKTAKAALIAAIKKAKEDDAWLEAFLERV